MNRLDPRLTDLLDPVRDIAVGGILETMAALLDSGAEVKPEPKLRDADGHVVREGQLRLPRRGDLLVTRSERTLTQRVESASAIGFEPVCLIAEDGFTTLITPFRWDAAEVTVESRQATPNWTPLRHWFLEWFQSRYSEVAPDLDGALHSLTGPRQRNGAWEFLIDFGSAPIDCFGDMLVAFATSGAQRVRLGHL